MLLSSEQHQSCLNDKCSSKERDQAPPQLRQTDVYVDRTMQATRRTAERAGNLMHSSSNHMLPDMISHLSGSAASTEVE